MDLWIWTQDENSLIKVTEVIASEIDNTIWYCGICLGKYKTMNRCKEIIYEIKELIAKRSLGYNCRGVYHMPSK